MHASCFDQDPKVLAWLRTATALQANERWLYATAGADQVKSTIASIQASARAYCGTTGKGTWTSRQTNLQEKDVGDRENTGTCETHDCAEKV